MTGYGWVSLIALVGWLVLAVGAFRAERVNLRKGLMMALAWISIFLLVAAVFTVVGA